MTPKIFLSGKRKITVSFGKPLYKHDIFLPQDKLDVDDYKRGAHVIMSKIEEQLLNV